MRCIANSAPQLQSLELTNMGGVSTRAICVLRPRDVGEASLEERLINASSQSNIKDDALLIRETGLRDLRSLAIAGVSGVDSVGELFRPLIGDDADDDDDAGTAAASGRRGSRLPFPHLSSVSLCAQEPMRFRASPALNLSNNAADHCAAIVRDLLACPLVLLDLRGR
jgi:hypothetical protein